MNEKEKRYVVDFAVNATLGTTHALMRYCVPSFPFFNVF